MTLGRAARALLLAAVLAGGAPAPAAVAEDEATIEVPTTIPKVAYTTSLEGARGGRFNLKGDLTLAEDTIELATDETVVVIQLDEVHSVSFGTLPGDVDTHWVVLGLGHPEPIEIVGLRDGSRLGFFGDTRRLFETVRAYVRQQGAAQYDVPDGFRAWDPLQRHLTLAVPEGWHEWTDELLLDAEEGFRGTVVLSAEPLRAAEQDGRSVLDPEALARARSGEMSALWLTLAEAPRGASCEGLSQKALAREREAVSAELGLGLTADALAAEPWTVEGCKGVRLSGTGRDAAGRPVLASARTVARGPTLYRFTTLRQSGDGEAPDELVRTILDTIRLALAFPSR